MKHLVVRLAAFVAVMGVSLAVLAAMGDKLDVRIERGRRGAIDTLGLTGAFDGEAVEWAVAGHVPARGEASATYTLNPQFIIQGGSQ